ncbi:hypothetical protein Q0M94_05235 [Deinococcus radiomollis]|uniref:hypothetical protein n=1 Tax=Deinococcus radiomollis TaxID=468916 RepID=UPI0038915FAF
MSTSGAASGRHLSHASHAQIQAGRLIAVPDSVSDRLALAVILGEYKRRSEQTFPPESEVLVVGAGMLGLLSMCHLIRRAHWACIREPV